MSHKYHLLTTLAVRLCTVFLLFAPMCAFPSFLLTASAQGRPDLVWMRPGFYGSAVSMKFSPDMKYLVAGTSAPDNLLKIIRLEDSVMMRSLKHSSSVHSIDFTPDSKVVMACDLQKITLYSVPGGEVIRQISAPTTSFRTAVLSQDGNLIAAVSDDRLIRVWRVSDGTLRYTLAGHTGGINSLAFSHNNLYLSSISSEGQDTAIHLWDVSTGLLLREIAVPLTNQFLIQASVFNSDDSIILLAYYQNDFKIALLYGYRLSDGQQTHAFGYGAGNGAYRQMCLSPNGTYMSITYGDRYGTTFSIIRASTGEGISGNGINGHSRMVFTPDEQTLATHLANSGVGDPIRLWRVSDGSAIKRIPEQNQTASCFAVQSAANDRMVTNNGGSLVVRRASNGMVIREIPTVSTKMGLSGDGSLVAGQYEQRGDNHPDSYAVWRTSDGTLVRRIVGDFNGVDISPDGTLIALRQTVNGGRFDATAFLTVLRISDGGGVFTSPGGGSSVAFSSNGQYLASTHGWPLPDNSVRIFRVSDWQTVQTIPGNFGILAISSDGKFVATGNGNQVKVWNVTTGALLSQMQTTGNLWQMAFSPDGQILATGTDSNRLTFWDVTSGTMLTYYDEETSGGNIGVLSVSYSSDGKFVYYGRGDGTVCCLLNPFRNAVFPNKGGNTGNVTFRIITPSTFPVPDGATVTLQDGVHPDISVNATSINDHVLTGIFALNGTPLGKRDVVITKPNGEMQTFPLGFTIEQGTAPRFVTVIIGANGLRGNRPQKFGVVIHNVGNVDTTSTLWISFPMYLRWQIEEPKSNPNDWLDWTQDEKDIVIPYKIPLLPASGSFVVKLTLTLPDDPAYAHVLYDIHAWATKR